MNGSQMQLSTMNGIANTCITVEESFTGTHPITATLALGSGGVGRV